MNELEIKAHVRERDNHRCTGCGMTNAEHVSTFGRYLDVHRVEPGSEYSVDSCVTLCRRCHKERHRQLRGTTGRRSGHNINVWIDPELGAIFESIRKKECRNVKRQVEFMIMEYVRMHAEAVSLS